MVEGILEGMEERRRMLGSPQSSGANWCKRKSQLDAQHFILSTSAGLGFNLIQ